MNPHELSVPWARSGPLLATLLLGCASAGTTAGGLYQVPATSPQGSVVRDGHPCWVLEPCPPYSLGAYLLGVGGGPSAAAAEVSARAAIAKIFEVRIREERESVDSLYHASTGTGVTWTSMATSERVASRSTTDKVLTGVEIVERHEGDEGFDALAVLDRKAAQRRLLPQLESLDEEMVKLVEAAEATTSMVGALRRVSRAIQLAEEYAYLNAELGIIHPEGKSRRSRFDLNALLSNRSERLGPLRLSVTVEGFEANGLKAACADGLTRAGFTLTSRGKGHVSIYGTSGVEETTRQVGSHTLQVARANLVIDIGEETGAGTRRTIRTVRYDAEVTSNDKRKARRLAAEQLAARVAGDDKGAISLDGETQAALFYVEEDTL